MGRPFPAVGTMSAGLICPWAGGGRVLPALPGDRAWCWVASCSVAWDPTHFHTRQVTATLVLIAALSGRWLWVSRVSPLRLMEAAQESWRQDRLALIGAAVGTVTGIVHGGPCPVSCSCRWQVQHLGEYICAMERRSQAPPSRVGVAHLARHQWLADSLGRARLHDGRDLSSWGCFVCDDGPDASIDKRKSRVPKI
jgi:hypothetical protein